MNAPAFQPELIHETVYDALRDAVRAIGGSKTVGAALWPTKTLEDAKNRVNDCCNPGRAEKFSLEELIWIMRAAREANCHAAMQFIAAECGYAQPAPLSPTDELADLQRQFIIAVQQQNALVKRMERLTVPRAVAA